MIPTKGCIYKITSPSGKIYIGQTIHFNMRMNTYRNKGCKRQPKLFASINKYGFNSHIVEIIEEVITDYNGFLLNLKEIYWIDYYDSCNTGLNCELGGKSPIGRRMKQETKDKIGNANKHSEKHKAAMKKRGTTLPKVPWNKGNKYTEEEKKVLYSWSNKYSNNNK